MAITGAGVAYSVIGGLVLFSGIRGSSLSGTVKSALAGNLNVTDTEPVSSGNSGGTAATGSGAVASGSAAAAQAYAKSQMSRYGWDSDGADWSDLVSLWNQESGWSNTAQNPSSGAYGIPQALPYTKMPKAAWPPSAGGTSDTESQIDWGLEYIQDTYGSPQMAWAHEQANDWY